MMISDKKKKKAKKKIESKAMSFLPEFIENKYETK